MICEWFIRMNYLVKISCIYQKNLKIKVIRFSTLPVKTALSFTENKFKFWRSWHVGSPCAPPGWTLASRYLGQGFFEVKRAHKKICSTICDYSATSNWNTSFSLVKDSTFLLLTPKTAHFCGWEQFHMKIHQILVIFHFLHHCRNV